MIRFLRRLRVSTYPADPGFPRRRAILMIDGVIVAAAGLAMIIFQRPLAAAMGWPSAGTLVPLGVAFLIWGGALAAWARTSRPTRGFTLAVAVVNNLWFDATIILIALLRPPLTGIGWVVVLGSAIVAMIFSVLQVMSTRRT